MGRREKGEDSNYMEPRHAAGRIFVWGGRGTKGLGMKVVRTNKGMAGGSRR